MIRTIRVFLFLQAVLFVAAALTHFGVLMHGLEHLKAGIAESVIGSVLLTGLVLTLLRPGSARTIGIAAQAFALFGTVVGISMIAIGVGPRTTFDISLHACMVTALVAGLFAARAR